MNNKIIERKQESVNELSKSIKEANSTFIVEYRGLTVAKLADLRKELRKENSDMKVYKNTLVTRAVDELGYHDLKNDLTGPNAFIFSMSNPAISAKILTKFAKKNNKMVIKSAIVEKRVVSKNDVITLSTLSSKEDMISKLLGCLKAPLNKLAGTLDAVAKR